MKCFLTGEIKSTVLNQILITAWKNKQNCFMRNMCGTKIK